MTGRVARYLGDCTVRGVVGWIVLMGIFEVAYYAEALRHRQRRSAR